MALPLAIVLAATAVGAVVVSGGTTKKKKKKRREGRGFRPFRRQLRGAKFGRMLKELIGEPGAKYTGPPILAYPARGARGELTIPAYSGKLPNGVSAARQIDTGFIPVGQWEYNFLVAVRALDSDITGFARIRAQVVGTNKTAVGDATESEIAFTGPMYSDSAVAEGNPYLLGKYGMDPIWTCVLDRSVQPPDPEEPAVCGPSGGGMLLFAGFRMHYGGAFNLSFVSVKEAGDPAHAWYLEYEWTARRLTAADAVYRPERPPN